MADVATLPVRPLEFLSLRRRFVEKTIRDRRTISICPCQVVTDFLVDQNEANEILGRMKKQGFYKVIPLSVFDPDDQAWKGEQTIDLESRLHEAANKSVAFVRPEIADDLRAVANLPAVAEYQSIVEMLKRLCPEYKSGPPLRDQPKAAELKRQLEWSFQCLAVLGLISPRILVCDFAHTSVVMLMRKALGLPGEYSLLAPFIENPVRFLVSALGNSLGIDRRNAQDVRELDSLAWKLKTALENAIGSPAPQSVQITPDGYYGEHRLPGGYVALLLEGVEEGFPRVKISADSDDEAGVEETRPGRSSGPLGRRLLRAPVAVQTAIMTALPLTVIAFSAFAQANATGEPGPAFQLILENWLIMVTAAVFAAWLYSIQSTVNVMRSDLNISKYRMDQLEKGQESFRAAVDRFRETIDRNDETIKENTQVLRNLDSFLRSR